MRQNQMELRLPRSANVVRPRSYRRRRHPQARWWFERMRTIVNESPGEGQMICHPTWRQQDFPGK